MLAFLKLIPFGTILKYGAPLLVAIGLVWGIYHLGSNHGEATIQAKWDHQKQVDADFVKTERAKLAVKEDAHAAQDRKISDDLAQAKINSVAAVAAARADTDRLRSDGAKREAVYRADAEGSATQRANLASYAAQLDRSLATGVGLVEELQATVELRDGQIRGLAAQINNDRQLISGQSTANGNDAVHPQ